MRKLILLPIFALFVGFTSCDMVSQLIPDVDETVVETYNVVIEADVPSGVTESHLVDISSYPEFQNYSQYIEGYLINNITYEVLNFDASEDLHFEGSVEAYDIDSTTIITVGSIPLINLSEIAALGGENDMDQDPVAAEQLLSWLDDPGSFNIKFVFGYKNDDGTAYSFDAEEIGDTFDVKVRMYLTIITGV